MRKEFNIQKYQEAIGFSDEQIARILAGDSWEKECIGKTQEEIPHYKINKQWTLEIPETPKEVCELIIKNGGCFNVKSVYCINCPLRTREYDCGNDVKSAKAWLRRNSPLSHREKGMMWFKENGIKKGDKVKVSKLWEQGERGCMLTPFRFLLDAEGEFIDIDSDGDVKIVTDNGKVIFVPYFVLEKVEEKTYRELQKEWVETNGIKKGSKVKVVRTWDESDFEFTWDFNDEKVNLQGVACEVVGICNGDITLQSPFGNSSYSFPYFALEVIPEPTYKPYPSFEKWMVGRKLKYKGGVGTIVGTPILSYPSYLITVVTRGHYTMTLGLEKAFNDCIYEDGTPFGVKE